MQAIILATFETRHKNPLTETIPAPMLPLANRPVMQYAVELLARQGFKHVFVSLHHMAGDIERYFGTGRRWGLSLHYILQRDAWGDAGALRWASRLLVEPFIVLPGDALVDVDLGELIERHQAAQPFATLVTHDPIGGYNAPESPAQPLSVYPEDRVLAPRAEPLPPWQLEPTGAYLFEPGVLDLIPPRTSFDIQHQLVPAIQAAGLPVQAYRMEGYWNPLGTSGQYHAAQQAYLYSAMGQHPPSPGDPCIRFPRVEGRQVSRGIWVGKNHAIHPTARIAPPVCIGDNCQIAKDAEIGPEVVLGHDVLVDEEATVHQSTILPLTYVGRLVDIDNRLVDKNLVVDVPSGGQLRVPDPYIVSNAPNSILQPGFKKLANKLVAFGLLLAFSPLLLPLCLAIRITAGKILAGSPRQRLPVCNGDAKSAGKFPLFGFVTLKQDGSQTAIGRWMERWELQRLPELWNVVRGEIDLVGVKALTPAQGNALTEPWQMKRNEGRVGFTGLWYLQDSGETTLDELLVTDVFYVATHTWLKDLHILAQTPSAWWMRLRKNRNRVTGPSRRTDGTENP